MADPVKRVRDSYKKATGSEGDSTIEQLRKYGKELWKKILGERTAAQALTKGQKDKE